MKTDEFSDEELLDRLADALDAAGDCAAADWLKDFRAVSTGTDAGIAASWLARGERPG